MKVIQFKIQPDTTVSGRLNDISGADTNIVFGTSNSVTNGLNTMVLGKSNKSLNGSQNAIIGESNNVVIQPIQWH